MTYIMSLACFIQEANHSGVIHVLRLLASSGRYHTVSRLVSLPKYAGGLCTRRPSQAEVRGTPMGAGDRSQHCKSLACSWGFDPCCSGIRLTVCQVAWKAAGGARGSGTVGTPETAMTSSDG